MSADQRGSFYARVSGFPIHVTADDQFKSQERDSILATIREWNKVGESFGRAEIFRLKFGSIPSSVRTLDPHQCGSELGGDQDFYVVREQNQSHWSSIGFVETTPGATIRCYSDGGNQMDRQIVYMNPSLMNSGQFDQAFSHEFGHAIGLDHSCSNKAGAADYVSCQALKGVQSHPYFQAVMYPILKAVSMNFSLNGNGNGNSSNSSDVNSRVSSVLQINDQIRGECVVGPAN